jgi:large subunit ribosomal protein L15
VKLHDLKPAPGSRATKRRVGRGIAAGQGKTAGRGTKGQKARAGGTIPAWFEGGQTPLHQRIPKLRGFRNPFRIEYEIVNLGDIARLAELGALEGGEMPASKPSKKGAAPTTVNQEILRAAGLIRRLDRPMKVLGGGELSTPLFVVADAFSASARSKIEAAGGTVSVLEVPGQKRKALGVDDETEAAPADTETESKAPPASEAEAADAADATATSIEETTEEEEPAPAKRSRGTRAAKAATVIEAEYETAPAPPADADGAGADETPAPGARAPRKPRAAKPDADA